MRRSSVKLLAALALCAFVGEVARADVLLDQTNAVGLPTIAAPSHHEFTATTAQALTVTLTDFQIPAAFGALQIAVTLGDALVGSASIDSSHTATVALPAATGNYVLYVVGTPDSTQGFGSFGVCVSLTSDATHACIAVDSYSDSVATPSPPSSSVSSTLNTNFTSTTLGTYTVTLTDDAFPVALNSASAGVFQGTTPIAVNIQPGTPTPISLAADQPYQLLAAATANSATPAGLYGIRITDPSGAPVFDRSLPVGSLAAGTFVNNPSAQALTLTLNDYAYPTALATLGAAVTFGGGSALGELAAAGSTSNIMAPEGNLQVWTYAAAGAQPGVYGLSLASSSSSLLSITNVVNPANTSTAGSFAFAVNIPAAGTYQLSVTDFQFPGALQAPPTATVAQNGLVLTQNTNGDFTAAAGVAIIVVSAQPPQSGSGIFDVTVQSTGASPKILLDQTQALGGEFNTQTIILGTTGGYNVTLTDLAFPQIFEDLAVVVSYGGQVLGKVYGAGTFAFTGTPGATYLITFVSTPKAQSATASIVPGFGLYALNVESSPPTVVFTSSASSVSAGGAVTLTWSSTNATTCTASGGTGWTGSQMTNGSLAVAVSTTETLTLTCTGPGGMAAQTVTVTTTAPSGKSGGGAIDLTGILALLALWVASLSRSRRAGGG
jgi:plastocyanin